MASNERLDVLAFGAHPDDVELCAGGTIALLVRQGYRVGITDFTTGQLGTRGTPELRLREAAEAARILGVAVRENLGMMDGGLENTRESQLKLIEVVRRHRPHVVIMNPEECRHPDHGKAARLAVDALFYGGLKKIETFDPEGRPQEPWRPHHVLHYMQSVPFDPTFVVDVSEVWEQRMEAMLAFRSQFYSEAYEAEIEEPATFISNPDFLHWVEARARTYGYMVGARFGEPFLYRHGPFGVGDLMAVLGKERPFR